MNKIQRLLTSATLVGTVLAASIGAGVATANEGVPGAISLGGGSGQLWAQVVVNWHVDGADTATISMSGPGLNKVFTVSAPTDPAYEGTLTVAGGTYTVSVTERYTAPDGSVYNYGPTSQSIQISPKPTPAPAPTAPPAATAPPAPTAPPATAPTPPPAGHQQPPPAATTPPSSGGGHTNPGTPGAGSSATSCDDFDSYSAAQQWVWDHNWNIPANMDPDGDGIACWDYFYGREDAPEAKPRSGERDDSLLAGLFDDDEDGHKAAGSLRHLKMIDLMTVQELDSQAAPDHAAASASPDAATVAVATEPSSPPSAPNSTVGTSQGSIIVPLIGALAAAGLLGLLVLMLLRRRSAGASA